MAARRRTARDLAHIAIFAALIAALGLPGTLTIGASAVPITLQTLGVMLAGCILGARKGLLAVAVFELLTLAGLPLLAGGRGGIQYFTVAPSAGYLYGFLLGVVVIGALTKRLLPRYPLWLGVGANMLGGIVVVYAIGVPFTALRLELPLWAAVADAGKFLPGDVLKAIVAAVIARQVHRAYPGLLGHRPRADVHDAEGHRGLAPAADVRPCASADADHVVHLGHDVDVDHGVGVDHGQTRG